MHFGFPVKVRFPFPPLLMPAPLSDIDGNYFAITNRFLFLWSTVINSLLFWYWMVLANFDHISHQIFISKASITPYC